LGRVSGLFQENRIGQPLKTKSAYRKAFYDGAAIATLKSRLKMKPINQVLIMVFLQNIEQFVNKINSFVKKR
jgi:hypothetical protein